MPGEADGRPRQARPPAPSAFLQSTVTAVRRLYRRLACELPSVTAPSSRRDRQLATNAVSAILAALKTNLAEPKMQQLGWSSLCTFAGAADDSFKGLETFRAAVTSMKKHVGDPKVQSECCRALKMLSNGGAEKKQAVACAAGALDAVVAALAAHPDDDEVQQSGCIACSNLICLRNETQRAAVAAGVLQAAIRALQRPNVNVTAYALLAIFTVVHRNAANARAAIAAGAIEAVTAAAFVASSHSMSADDEVWHTLSTCSKLALHSLICYDGDQDEADACERRAVRAGALEAMEVIELTNSPSLHTAFVERLKAASRRHDEAAVAGCEASCKRCSSLRAAGTMCALPGCGAMSRVRDGEGSAAKTSLRRCGACRADAYCSVGHQHADWARHKAAGCRRTAA